MQWVLLLGHAFLGVVLLATTSASSPTRRRTIEVASIAGVLLGAGLVVAGETGTDPWRSVAFEPHATMAAGIVVAAAWLVTGALAGRARDAEPALTGLAASGLLLATTGTYAVPALIFWLCSSLALALAGGTPARWAVLAASDAALCSGVILHTRAEDTWGFVGLEGAPLVLLAIAAVVRSSAYLVWGPGREAAATLVVGGGVAVAAAHADVGEPRAALILVALAGAAAVVALVRRPTRPPVVAVWSALLALAVFFVAPAEAPVAGAAAALTVAAVALWPFTAGRGGVARALMASAVPLTAAGATAVSGAAQAFARVDVAWTVVAVLFPIALAGAAVLGGRVARTDATAFVPEAVLATWMLLGSTVAIGIAAWTDSGGVVALQLVALAAGAGAAVFVRRDGIALEPARPAVRMENLREPSLPRAVGWVALATGAAVVVAAVWLTVAGLRVGFL